MQPIQANAGGFLPPTTSSNYRNKSAAQGLVRAIAKVASGQINESKKIPAAPTQQEQPRTVVLEHRGRDAAPQPEIPRRRTLADVVARQAAPPPPAAPIRESAPQRPAYKPSTGFNGASLAGRVMAGMKKKK